ncbi:MAG: SDR family NAD(P)-dependent oxidoreductase [Acidimicrobiia bacterium]|nr:SDR family NAD(P)-dependent oxidoreductase [Acidimicrobiia bacterium]
MTGTGDSVGERFAYRGSRIVVTGASSGIGADLAVRLAARGAKLLLVARSEEKLAAVAERCGGQAAVCIADLSDLGAVSGVIEAATRVLGGVDVLVNNAGSPYRIRADHLTFDDVEGAMRLNFLSAAKLTFGVLPAMLEQREGRVVFVSSVAGRLPAPREGAYVASKYAMTGLAEVLAIDLRGSGIKVHVVHPGVIDTPLWDVPGQEASAYHGRRTPAGAVSDAVLRLLDTGRFDAFVPRRFRWVWRLRPVLGDRFLSQAAAFDEKGAPEAWT